MPSYLLQKKSPRNSTIAKCGANCLEGSIWIGGGFGGRFGGYRVHYHLNWVSSDKSEKVFIFNKTHIDETSKDASGIISGAVIETIASEV